MVRKLKHSNRYFVDTEFIRSGNCIELLSIGIVKEKASNGELKEIYYAVNKDCDLSRANDWVKKNVIPQLGKNWKEHKTVEEIADDIVKFTGTESRFRLWGWFPSTDWVVFNSIFKDGLPSRFPRQCLCLRQWMIHLGVGMDSLPEGKDAHRADLDALWNRDLYHHLKNIEGKYGYKNET